MASIKHSSVINVLQALDMKINWINTKHSMQVKMHMNVRHVAKDLLIQLNCGIMIVLIQKNILASEHKSYLSYQLTQKKNPMSIVK